MSGRPGSLAADVVVVGGGVAGCAAALSAARSGASVVLLTKLADPEEANTRYAQGGIIYTGPEDSPELLAQDILAAGAGAGDPEAAARLAGEGPPLVRRLLIDELEVPFDRDADGFEGLHLTREGAHSARRIVHHRDTTGSEVQRALTAAVEAEERVSVLAGAVALGLAGAGGRCTGVHAVRDGEPLFISGSVVLATGGLGGLYEHTTNPPSATGDGVALALRAGARVRDLHYVQFHPTALCAPDVPGERFLISEAVRGEGGVLRDGEGREFVDHPLGSLAPRDVVAREISAMMERTGSPCAYLDLTHLPGAWVSERFPAITARCRAQGLDLTAEPVPVMPAAHYACGGVAADGRGRTSLPGLWAAGEVAGTGLHGANRLASTSLLEGLVWGWRSGGDAARTARPLSPPTAGTPDHAREPAPEQAWERLRSIMWRRAGLVRTGEGIREGLLELSALEREFGETRLRGPLLVARTVLRGALLDGESRGCHYRRDGEPGQTAAGHG